MTVDMPVLCAAFGLSPCQGRLVNMLLDKPVVPTGDICDAFGYAPEGVRIIMHRTRARLLKHGIAVASQHGVGYHIKAPHRAAMLEAVAKFETMAV